MPRNISPKLPAPSRSPTSISLSRFSWSRSFVLYSRIFVTLAAGTPSSASVSCVWISWTNNWRNLSNLLLWAALTHPHQYLLVWTAQWARWDPANQALARCSCKKRKRSKFKLEREKTRVDLEIKSICKSRRSKDFYRTVQLIIVRKLIFRSSRWIPWTKHLLLARLRLGVMNAAKTFGFVWYEFDQIIIGLKSNSISEF